MSSVRGGRGGGGGGGAAVRARGLSNPGTAQGQGAALGRAPRGALAPRARASNQVRFNGAGAGAARGASNPQRSSVRGTPNGRQTTRSRGTPATTPSQRTAPPSSARALAFQSRGYASASAPASASDTASYPDRFQALKKQRERERADAIAQGFLADPDKPRTLADAITPVGTCPDMCPEFERVERVVQKDVWGPEVDKHTDSEDGAPAEHRMVKKFRRAAAGIDEQLPSDLRPPSVLKETVDYLFNDVVGNAETLGSVHHFVWDRTRAIRNDFSIQQITKPADVEIAIACYERIARFHILSLHQLAVPEKPYDKYDWYQEREQLDRTLLSLMQYYDDSKGRLACANEAEFRAYLVIFQVQDPTPDLEERVNTWDRHVRCNPRVRKALDIYAAACNVLDPQGPLKPRANHSVAQEDWNRFLVLVQSTQTSYLMACVSEIYFNLMRRATLNAVWRAFRPQGSKLELPDFTLDLMTDMLGFDQEEQTEHFCQQYGFVFKQSITGEYGDAFLDLNSVQGKSFPAPTQGLGHQTFSDRLVESKRADRTLPAIINGLSVADAQRQGLIEAFGEDSQMEEDEDSLFVPQEPVKKDRSTAHSSASPSTPFTASKSSPPLTSTPPLFAPDVAKPSMFGQPSTGNTSTAAAPPGAFAFGQPSTNNTSSSNAPQTASIFAQPPITSSAASPFAAKPAQSPFSSFGQASAADSVKPSDMKPSASPFSSFGRPSASDRVEFANSSATQPNKAAETNGDQALVNGGSFSSPGSLFATKTPLAETTTQPSFTNSFSPFAPKPVDQVTASTSKDDPSAPSSWGTTSNSMFNQPTSVSPHSLGSDSTSRASAQQPASLQSPKSVSTGFTFATTQQQLPQDSAKVRQPSNDPFKFSSTADSAVANHVDRNQQAGEVSKSAATSANTSISPKVPANPPSRKPSFTFQSQPKKPSPLSQSFTANDSNSSAIDTSPAIPAENPLSSPKRTPSFGGGTISKATVDTPSPVISPATTQLDSSKSQPYIQSRPKVDILEKLAEEVITDINTGLIRQFVEYHARTTVMEIYDQLYMENIQELADNFRKETLSYRYGRMWRDICWQRRLVRQGREKRRRARRTHEAKELRRRLGVENNAVDQFLKSSQQKHLKGSIADARGRPGIESRSAMHLEQRHKSSVDPITVSATSTAEYRVSANGSDRRTSLDQGESLKNSTIVNRLNNATNVAESPGRTTRGITPTPRSSYLTFGTQSIKGQGNDSTPSSRSNYFRLKALGIDPNGTTNSSLGKKRARGQSEEDLKELPPPSKKSRTPPRSSVEVDELQYSIASPIYSPLISRLDVGETRPSSTSKPLSAAQQEDEALFARARAARQAMSDTAAWYRSELQRDERQRAEELSRPIETSSMQKARQEARLRASQTSSFTESFVIGHIFGGQNELSEVGSPNNSHDFQHMENTGIPDSFAGLNQYQDDASWDDGLHALSSTTAQPHLPSAFSNEEPRGSVLLENPLVESEADLENVNEDGPSSESSNQDTDADPESTFFGTSHREEEEVEEEEEEEEEEETGSMLDEEGYDESEDEVEPSPVSSDNSVRRSLLPRQWDAGGDFEDEDECDDEEMDDDEDLDESEEDYDEEDVQTPQEEMQNENSVIKAGTGTAEDAFELSD
ncbi:hypothetical protein MBLNU459_g5450t2 [Dothideomycetes sp. NU459]